MLLRSFLAVFILQLCCTLSFGQEGRVVKLTRHEKDSLKTELDVMVAEDQKYRWMAMLGELDEQKLAPLKAMDDASRYKRMRDVRSNKVGISKFQKDSLDELMGHIDSVNFLKLSGIIARYGFPSKSVGAVKASVMLMHTSPLLMNEGFFKMLMQEVKNGNMDGLEYARIYDRIQLEKKGPELYYVNEHYEADGESGTLTPATNRAREEIGLGKYKK